MMKSLERSKSDEDIRDAGFKLKLEKTANSLPITPQKQAGMALSSEDPLTPTANLKMLVSAAFGIASARDEGRQKRELFVDKNDDEDNCSTSSDSTEDKDKQDYFERDRNGGFDKKDLGSGRKLKSLGLLCQKFLSKYPEGSEGSIISLHEVAKELSVERRRIYDIVNVLESLEYVTKQGKNTYVWHGSSRLVPTLSKLKALAKKIYGGKGSTNFENVDKNNIPSLWLSNGIMVRDQESDNSNSENASTASQDEDKGRRRSKSLGIFCQKLIMLFMAAENPVIALEEAAKEIIEGTEDPHGKTRTKVRRLYDIANILTSMRLIEKTGSRKAAFKWVGVDLESLQPDTVQSSVRKLESRSLSASNIAIRNLNPQKKNKMPRTKSAATIHTRKRSSTDSKDEKTCKFMKPDQDNKCPEKTSLGSIETNDKKTTAKDLNDESDRAGQIEETDVQSPRRIANIKSEQVSPNERIFREEFKRLQERFPEKLQNPNGLLHLITAHNEIQKQETQSDTSKDSEFSDKGSRCCLLGRLEDEGSPISKAGLIKDSSSLGGHAKNTLKDSKAKVLSLSCLEVIMDQYNGKKKAITLRNELEKVLTKTTENPKDKRLLVDQAITEKSKRVVQTASIGIQASFGESIGPVNEEAPTATKKRKANFNEWISSASSGNIRSKTSTEVNNIKSTKESPRLPALSTASSVSLNDIRTSPSTKPAGSVFLVSLKQSPNGQNRSLADAIACLKGNCSSQLAQLMPQINVSDSEKLKTPNVENNGVVEMVPIAPTRVNIRPNTAEKENSHYLDAFLTQSSPTLKDISGRAVFPLQSVDTNMQNTSPVIFSKGSRLCEETPMRYDVVDIKAQKVQRQLHRFITDNK
eukprot:gene5078-195_t